ncbi:zinc ribbon domain-containing protein [Rhizobacter sp. AJA081-3]|nr:zinc ribbon domain-containing protein [Rhizobacter sp. AJA081-3]
MAHACFECRTENADGATFCRACGVPMAALSADLPESDSLQALHCEDCGHRNPPGSTYCERCGYGLVALMSLGAPPATASTAAPAMAPAPETQAPPSEGAPTLAPPLPAAWRSAAAPDEDTFDPLSAPTLVMSHTAPSPLPPLEPSMSVRRGPRPLRWVAAGLGLLAVFALLAWLAGPSVPPAAMDAAPAPAAAQASAAAPAAAPLPASSPAPVMSAPAPASAALPAAAPAPASAPAASAPARKQVPEPVARKRALEAPAARSEPAPAPAPSAPAPVVAAPPAPPPERAKTVTELCAAANLLMRGFCEQRECRRGELAADPVCVKLRDAEQRRLFQQ